LEKMLAQAGVERSRLPDNPTIDDAGYEGTFIGHFSVHERRLGLPAGTLKQFVRQEQMPSWIVWREVDRKMKRLSKAEGSSLADGWMVPFALYLDRVEADKRVCHCMREALESHPLVKAAYARVFRRKSFEDLTGQLEALAAA
jgi:glutathione S-transferase